MNATNCDRYGCTIGGQQITYDKLRHYVCDECGGQVTHSFTWDESTEATIDRVACAACGCVEIVSERRYLEQISEGWEVEQGLPDALRALLAQGGPQCQSATESIAVLYG